MTSEGGRSTVDRLPQSGGSRLAVLGYRDFRLIWGDGLGSTVGTQMQLFAVTWQVFEPLRRRTCSFWIAGRGVSLQAGAPSLRLQLSAAPQGDCKVREEVEERGSIVENPG